MYAVIKTGGKQYRVASGDRLKIELLSQEVGDTIEFDQVLMVGKDGEFKLGKPFVDGGKVTATVTSQGRHDKIKIIKFRRRKHYKKQMGHRQYFTEIEIKDIKAD